ncbi:hypothetical protein L596_023150 [Steinernema carpocapsae]|uniref:CHK kinase-like domain-containing protein n=1 Tax=Steinernema carpocapsae TaxID=34508 RepID=A0A4U5MCS6_STECR|nr:hypothetical protein L596_023150 [Steinernema carpocapsae]
MVLWEPPQTLGAILMSDLSQTCHIQQVQEGLTLTQLLNLAEHLAELHNAFLAIPDLQRNELEQKFSPYEGCIDFQVNHIIPKAVEIAKKHPKHFQDKLDPILSLLQNPEYHRYTAGTISEALNLPRVLVHGDLWSLNILWTNENPSQVGAFLDWQGHMIGSLAFDLSTLLILCTSTQIRRTHQNNVISRYYSRLHNPSFSQATVIQAVNKTAPYTAAHMMFGISLLEARLTPQDLEEMLSRASAALDDVIVVYVTSCAQKKT